MRIRSAVLHKPGLPPPYAQSKPLEIMELDLAPPGRGEVLVKMAAAGLCHSDLSVIDGARPRPMPMALGHEAAGIVESVGDGVTDLKVGDHVVLVFVASCLHCGPCSSGRPALCEPAAKANAAGTLLSGERRLSFKAEPVNHLLGVAAFSTHAVVARESCVKIDPDLPLDLAALFGCAVLTGVGAAINTAKMEPGQSAAVVGLGGVGLSAVLGAKVAGARQIIAVDLSDEKLDFAKKLGATQTVNARSNDAVGEIRRLSGNGVDVALEMAGSVPALELAYAATNRGGMTVTAGLPHPDKKMALAPLVLVAEERTLKGSYVGSSAPQRDVPRMIALFRAGRLPVDQLLTHRLKLDEINEGFDRLREGEGIRHVIMFD
jgi:alcohol dehydrogenase